MHKQANRIIIYKIFCFSIAFLSFNPCYAQKKTDTKKQVAPAKKTESKNSSQTPNKIQSKKTVQTKKTAQSNYPTQSKKPVVLPKKSGSQPENPEKTTTDPVRETPLGDKLELKPIHKTNPVKDIKTNFDRIIHYSIPDSTKAFAHQLLHKKDRDSIYYGEHDIVDLFIKLDKGAKERPDKKIYVTVFPGAALSPTSNIFITLISNFAFYSGPKKSTYLSSVDFNPLCSFKNEIVLPLKSNIWTRDNKYNIITDWQFSNYPEYTFGLGGGTQPADKRLVNLTSIKLHQIIQKKIHRYWFAGAGYYYDNHYNLQQLSLTSDSYENEPYTYDQRNTVSSGVALNLQSNTRRNPINPTGGHYFSMVYRVNLGMLGSSSSWQSLYTDYRRYFILNKMSPNILAFNSLVWLTFGGDIPYFDLPSVAGDVYGRTGRGYIYGRFRGQNMLYFESEYRFRLMTNGLLGGVVFANFSTFSQPVTNHFVYLLPAVGTGLRLKLNKQSKANLAMDIGFGLQGSWNIRFNIGEVF